MAGPNSTSSSEQGAAQPLRPASSNDEMRKVFDRFDTNGDGKISSEELEGVLKALGSNPTKEDLRRVMESVDVDLDGFISFEEFIHFWKSGDGGGNGESDLRAAFDMYDADHDGLISAGELQSVLQKLGEGYSIDQCSKMISPVDSDGDGSVNFSEFQKMMTTGKIAAKE